MRRPLDVPLLEDLASLPVEVIQNGDEPWVCSVVATAGDGDVLKLTWDAVAYSATVWWHEGESQRFRSERETVTQITCREERDFLEFWIRSEVDGLKGLMVVRVGASVTIDDRLLRG